MLTTPSPAELVAVLFAGAVIGGIGFGLIGASIWMHLEQAWYNGLTLWGGTGILLGYTGTLAMIQHWSSPRRIPNLNMAETRIVAVVPDRTEGTIGSFPLPPGEMRELAGELLIDGVRFTQARYKSRYGLRKYDEIRTELLRRQWAIPTYQNSLELTVAGRHVMGYLASPTPSRRISQ